MLTYSSLQYGTQITVMASYWHKSQHWRFSKTRCKGNMGRCSMCMGEGRREGERGKVKNSSCRVAAVNEDSWWAEALIASKITAFRIKHRMLGPLSYAGKPGTKSSPKQPAKKRHLATNKQSFQVESPSLISHRCSCVAPCCGPLLILHYSCLTKWSNSNLIFNQSVIT